MKICCTFFDFKLFSYSSITAHSECYKNGKHINTDCNISGQQKMFDKPVVLSPFLNTALGKQKKTKRSTKQNVGIHV